ncbi:MAG: hypothetical protein IJR41_03115 [Atopobiaceae bacterium]|nr:hypothetical protein [Atopobiaceae bacterium]
MDIEELLEKPYWVIDLLPKQVPADSPGRFFAVEQLLLAHPQVEALRARKLSVLLKLYCYHDLRISTDYGETWVDGPDPGDISRAMEKELYLLLPDEDVLITADPGDIYMTLYNATDDLLALIRQLATAEGLFVWQPPQG